jgi:hypothetical protein
VNKATIQKIVIPVLCAVVTAGVQAYVKAQQQASRDAAIVRALDSSQMALLKCLDVRSSQPDRQLEPVPPPPPAAAVPAPSSRDKSLIPGDKTELAYKEESNILLSKVISGTPTQRLDALAKENGWK